MTFSYIMNISQSRPTLNSTPNLTYSDVRRRSFGLIFASSCVAFVVGCGGGTSTSKSDNIPVAVTGSISGLTARGLVLQNGIETISVTPNATTFAFTTQVNRGASYAVTIHGQPSSQLCKINNGSGKAAADTITDVRITCLSPVVSTLAGTGTLGYINGPGNVAAFYYPHAIAVDSATGIVYVTDSYTVIRKIAPDGTVSAFSGNPNLHGQRDGPSGVALFNAPEGLATDKTGNLFVTDLGNNDIRKVSGDGTVNSLAGNSTPGAVNGSGAAASFSLPYGVAVDAFGNVFVADSQNNLVRKITAAGMVSTYAGTGQRGSANGPANSSTFNGPTGIVVDSAGNVYVADANNYLIRKIATSGIVTTVAGTGKQGFDNGPANSASFFYAGGIAMDHDGNLYVADSGNNLIRRIGTDGMVTAIAGTGQVGSTNGQGNVATFNGPNSLALDNAGNIYVTDFLNQTIRKITWK